MGSEPQAAPTAEAIEQAAGHFQSGKLDEAERLCRKMLQTFPDSARVLHLLGLVAHGLGKPELALESLQKAARFDASDPTLLNNLGEFYRASNRPEDAEKSYRGALAINPEYSEAHSNLALLMRSLGKLEQSARHFVNLGAVLEKSDRRPEAERAYRNAIAVKPDHSAAYHGLGRTLLIFGRMEEAEQHLRRALALNPESAEPYHDLGIMMLRLCRYEDAEQCFREALALKPGYTLAGFALSLALLARGDYRAGLPLYENRFEGGDPSYTESTRAFLKQTAGIPRWQPGMDLSGKSLLIWTDQGLGDSLMAARYLPQLRRFGLKRVAVYCDLALARLMRTVVGIDEVISKDLPPPSGTFDCHCPIMSLPLLFDTRLETIPNDVPYIRVPAELDRAWAERLADVPRPRVGLVWMGGKLFRDDPVQTRSVGLTRLAPLLKVKGISFVSLQKEKNDEATQAGKPPVLFDRMEECVDLLDTAALMEQLDLVISVDSAPAHLAGALGKPVWLLLRFEGEWRWMQNREDSIWYPTARLFRQTKAGEWGDVVQLAVTALKTFATGHTPRSRLRRVFDLWRG
jgi:Flp pilus assembly protein TadD